MKKAAFFIIQIFAFALLFFHCPGALPDKRPTDFNFLLKYDTMPVNQIDTFNNMVTKVSVEGSSDTVQLKLGQNELEDIYEHMKSISILKYPRQFRQKSTDKAPTALHPAYYLKFQYGGKIKEIYWEDDINSNSRMAVQLRDLFEAIKQIAEEKSRVGAEFQGKVP